MKTSNDPRHLKRKAAVRALFARSFTKQKVHSKLASLVYKKKDELDPRIALSAPTWPIDKLNKIDLAILRLAVYELMYKTKTPQKVVIDEAVELAKEYGGESSPSFINGVLGSVLENLKKMRSSKNIKNILARRLGLEAEDISPNDSFSWDLHMSPVDLSDFAQELEELGYNITPEGMSEYSTVSELLEHLSEGEDL